MEGYRVKSGLLHFYGGQVLGHGRDWGASWWLSLPTGDAPA